MPSIPGTAPRSETGSKVPPDTVYQLARVRLLIAPMPIGDKIQRYEQRAFCRHDRLDLSDPIDVV